MVKKKYQNSIKKILLHNFPPESKIFIFGSSARSDKFHDIDVGIKASKIDKMAMINAKEELEESMIPYKVDLVDFAKADKNFQKEVLKEKVIWLT